MCHVTGLAAWPGNPKRNLAFNSQQLIFCLLSLEVCVFTHTLHTHMSFFAYLEGGPFAPC